MPLYEASQPEGADVWGSQRDSLTSVSHVVIAKEALFRPDLLGGSGHSIFAEDITTHGAGVLSPRA